MDRTNQILISVLVVIGIVMVVRAQPSNSGSPAAPVTVAMADDAPKHTTRPVTRRPVPLPVMIAPSTTTDLGPADEAPSGDASLPPLESTLPGQSLPNGQLPEYGSTPPADDTTNQNATGQTPAVPDTNAVAPAAAAPAYPSDDESDTTNLVPNQASDQELLDRMMSFLTPDERNDFRVTWWTMDPDERQEWMLYLRSTVGDVSRSN